MVKELVVIHHCLGIENRVQGGLDLVLQSEAVPAYFAVRILEDPRVEPTKDVWGIVLRI